MDNPIVEIGRDEKGNRHEIMLNTDGTITDLYNERMIEPGCPQYTYYASKFFCLADLELHDV